MHELVHGLGFGITNFQKAYLPDGSKKHIVSSRIATDPDGTQDEIYSVVRHGRGRAPSGIAEFPPKNPSGFESRRVRPAPTDRPPSSDRSPSGR
jgi:hypothetical protein